MKTDYDSSELDTMAWTIDRTGIDTIPVASLRALGFQATRSGVSAAVTGVLVDPSAPQVARNRAFGFVAVALRSGRTTLATHVARAA